jgi:phenylacetate-CoA ligase
VDQPLKGFSEVAFNLIFKRMIQIKLRKYLFLLIMSLLKLKKYYRKYGNSLLLKQEGIHQDLKKLLSSARKNVPYYRANLSEIENDENLIKAFCEIDFVIQKSELKNNLSVFIDPSLIDESKLLNLNQKRFATLLKLYKDDTIFPVSTGGSTGTPLNFYISKSRGLKFIMQFIAIAKAIGWKVGESHIVCMQGGMYQQSNLLSELLPFIGTKAFVYREINLQTANIFASHLYKYRPVILCSPPSLLTEMACLLEELGIKLPSKLKGIMCVGEMLMDNQRKIIESYFETRIYNIYASNEMGIMAVECDQHNGLHILEASVFLENDADMNIIATAFDSECLPFIKYNTGDIGKIEFQECACGIKGKKITDLNGRIEEYLTDDIGNRIHASYLRKVLINANNLYSDAIINGQFIQKKDRTLQFSIQLRTDQNAHKILEYIRKEIKLLCNLDSNGIIIVSMLPASGKFRFFYKEN